MYGFYAVFTQQANKKDFKPGASPNSSSCFPFFKLKTSHTHHWTDTQYTENTNTFKFDSPEVIGAVKVQQPVILTLKAYFMDVNKSLWMFDDDAVVVLFLNNIT